MVEKSFEFGDLAPIAQNPEEFHHDSVDITIEKSYADNNSQGNIWDTEYDPVKPKRL